MLELVNTSLPNGLISGTHGFATVAMTRGVSDVLRGRLEALCAYAHRTSAHDETYYSENPVNWFHVVLPQGEHVVGRVAPSEFDYTGRTNRLARLFVLAEPEMPGDGGAAVLAAVRSRLAQAWEGEPRYLEPDSARLGVAACTAGTRTWISVFGAEGAALARRLALQLERNISSGGRTIYFRTSTTWDVSGEKLLALFGELIGLMPQALRSKVTFATYPAALPGGTTCHLRGVYDCDRLFDAVSAAQVWVDCEHGRVMHAELLPTEPEATPEPQPEMLTGPARHRPQPLGASSASRAPVMPSDAWRRGARTSAGNVRPTPYVPEVSRKTDPVLVGLIALTVLVLLGGGGFFFWMKHRNSVEMEVSGAAEALELARTNEVKPLASGSETNILKKADEAQAAQNTKEDAAKVERERVEAEAQKRKAEEKKEAQRRKDEEEKSRKEKVTLAKQSEARIAFSKAKNVRIGVVSKPDVTTMEEGAKLPRFEVFYFGSTGLTNAVASFKPIKSPVDRKKVGSWMIQVNGEDVMAIDGPKKNTDSLMRLSKSPCVIWYRDGEASFDWTWREPKEAKLFESADTCDLKEYCFGPDGAVFETWSRYHGSNTYYVVSWGIGSAQSVKWDRGEIALEDIAKITSAAEIEGLKEKVELAEKEYGKKENELRKLNEEKDKLERLHVEATNSYARIQAEIKTLKERMRNPKESDQGALKKQIKGKEREAGEHKDKANKARHDLDQMTDKKSIEVCQQAVDQKKQALDKVKNERDAVLKSPGNKKMLKSMRFVVTVKTKEEK